MRLKAMLASAIPAAVLTCTAAGTHAQVAPAAKVNGLPIAISIGISDYDIDYGPGRRMQGPVARVGMHVFHNVGIDVSARSIFMNTPSRVTRMQQNTFLAGAYYDAPAIWRIHPFARFAGGLDTIEFPSSNPAYTRDSYTVYAPSGGIEIPIHGRLSFRAEYEYEFWKKYHGPRDLNPQGFTIGATYYLSARHLRAHPEN
jgi:hypothetical protein